MLQDATGATVVRMAPSGPGGLVEELNAAAARHRLAVWASVLAVMLASLTGPVAPLVLLLAVPAVIWVALRDRARRRAVVFYDVQDAPAQWYEHLLATFTEVTAAERLWRIIASGKVVTTRQHKVNAGASTLLSRRRVRGNFVGPKHLVTNVHVPSLHDGTISVHFLPDRVLVRDGRRYTDVSYAALRLECFPTRFIETDRVPRDAAQVDTTWRYVNVKGGPDRRYKNNRRLPIMQYGRLSLSSNEGLNWQFDVSRLSGALAVGAAVKAAPRVVSLPTADGPIGFPDALTDAPAAPAADASRPPAKQPVPSAVIPSAPLVLPSRPSGEETRTPRSCASGRPGSPPLTTAARGFAVLDLETTGLSAQRERVIEVAVVHLDPQGRVQQTWATLIHPGRSSVGATHIHGITAADVRDAPVFEDIAPQLVGLLAGRVLVAHNAQFDLPFLRLEMARAGIQMPDVPHLCTLQESWRHLPALRRRRLSDCCAATAIPLLDAHTALADATAAAALLAWYLRAPTAKTWSAEPMLQAAAAVGWPSVVLPPSPRLPRPRGVPAQEAVPAGPGRLARLLDSLPLDAPGLSQPAVSGYVEVLAAALSDGVLTDAEVDSLVEAATGAGLSRFQVLEVHRGVVLGLARAVVVDGVVTAREQEQLAACAAALDLDAEEVTLALSGAHAERVVRLSEDLAPLPEGWALGDPLRLGDAIVFTGGGDIARAQLERRTREAGLRVVSAVSRRTAVLVAGNPASGTAKARKAMELGTRVVDLTTYGRLLDHVQPLLQSRPGTSAVTQPSPTREEAHPTTHTPHAFVDVKATEVRAWARARGITVGDRGRLPQALTDAYLAHLRGDPAASSE